MKKIILFSLVVLLSFYSNSQGTPDRNQKLIQSTFVNPGESVLKFRGLLTTQGDTSKTVINVDTISGIGTYSFLPAIQDSVLLGTVKFKHVFVQTSADKKIVVVGFSKLYSKKSGLYTREYIQKEYLNLAEYLDSVLEVPSVPYEKQSKMYKKDGKTAVPHTTLGLTWKKDNITYRIYLDETPVVDYASNVLGNLNVNAWKSN